MSKSQFWKTFRIKKKQTSLKSQKIQYISYFQLYSLTARSGLYPVTRISPFKFDLNFIIEIDESRNFLRINFSLKQPRCTKTSFVLYFDSGKGSAQRKSKLRFPFPCLYILIFFCKTRRFAPRAGMAEKNQKIGVAFFSCFFFFRYIRQTGFRSLSRGR